jgi:hypothetical protein
LAIEDDLQILEVKLKQLRLDYEQYFLGTRPREPVMLRGEVQKLVAIYSNVAIQNTAQRFRFSSLCSRFLTMRRQWDATQRKIEEGTYERHVFKARLHQRPHDADAAPQSPKPKSPGKGAKAGSEGDIFESYVEACRSTGQDVSTLTRERLGRIMEQQRETLRKQYQCAEVRFRVVVEHGKARLKATAVRGR